MAQLVTSLAARAGGLLLCAGLAACATPRLPITARELSAAERAELAECRDGSVLRPNAPLRCADLDAIEGAQREQLAKEQAVREAEAAQREKIRAAIARADAAAAAKRDSEALRLYTEAIALTEPRGADDLEVRQRVATLAARMRELPGLPEEARRFAVRAQARVEMEGADFAAATEEMTQAIRLAPWWADAHYNLGLMAAAAGQHAPAMNALEIYLELEPHAPDAAAIRAKIYQLELAAEDAAFTQELAGDWISTQQDSFRVEIGADGKFHIRAGIYEFALSKRGNELEGSASIASRRWDYCDIPGEQSSASGHISADGRSIELRTQVSRYATDKRWVGISMGMYECTSVVFLQRDDVTFSLDKSYPASSVSQ